MTSFVIVSSNISTITKEAEETLDLFKKLIRHKCIMIPKSFLTRSLPPLESVSIMMTTSRSFL